MTTLGGIVWKTLAQKPESIPPKRKTQKKTTQKAFLRQEFAPKEKPRKHPPTEKSTFKESPANNNPEKHPPEEKSWPRNQKVFPRRDKPT